MVAVVLVEPEYEENIGYIARLCKNFGAELVLVNPKCNWKSELARKRAMHGIDKLLNAKLMSFDEVLEKFSLIVATTAKTASEYNVNRAFITPEKLPKVKSMAILFGRESKGLSNEEIEKAHIVLHIPASKEYPTLNISHAVAIVLYELNKRTRRMSVAPKELREQMYRFYSQILEKLGYEKRKLRIQSMIFKRVIERAFINSREAFGITGVLKKILNRLQ